MKCPRCGYENLSPPTPCPNCDFTASPALLEALSHVEYLLQEIDGWEDVDNDVKAKLRVRYRQQKREIEVELDLRPPPLTPEEARQAAQEIWRRRRVLAWLERWQTRGWIKAEVAQDLTERNRARIQALETRLAEPEAPPARPLTGPKQQLSLLKNTRSLQDQIHQDRGWTSEEAYQAAKEELDRQIEELEIELGLRRPKPKPRPQPPPREAPATPPRPRHKREPITWERVWETLLSERTLRALLFVGVFLIFVAAVTLVILNWRRYAPWMQVTFLTGFTLFFYGLGWYVRNPMGLRESGIALSATGALLIPVDFYTIYLTTGIFPREAWAEVWLLASLVCLLAYVATAVRLRAQFFGYLVGVAIGSLCCALIQVSGMPTDWWSPTLCALALLMLLPTHQWEIGSKDELGHTFGRPFRHLALLTATAVLLIVSGVRLSLGVIGPPSTRLFRLTVALDWWLAWVTYAIAAVRRPRRSLTAAACVTAPVALYLTLALWAETSPFDPAWYALGWALLVPLYLIAGRSLQGKPIATPRLTGIVRRLSPTGEADRRPQARTLVNWAVVLILLAYGWALQEMSAAALVHAVLAGDLVLAVLLWQRPRLLPVASLLTVSAVTTWMTTLGLDLARYSVGWATLAILHVGLAVRCRPADRYTAQLYGAGFTTAALSLLPPLVALDRDAMVYALFNWIALATWMAWLAHQKKYRGLHRFLRLFHTRRRSVLHWAIAAPLPILFWLIWIGEGDRADRWLGVGFAALAWVCLGIGRWLAHKDRRYGRPWHVVSFTCSVVAPVVAATAPSVVVGGASLDRLLLAVTLLGTAALYFTYAPLFRRRWWLAAGGLVLPFGYVLLLDHLGLSPDPLAASLALVPTAYLLMAIWLEKRRGVSTHFLDPLYGVSHVVAAATVVWGFGGLWNRVAWSIAWTPEAQTWAAVGQLILGITYG
ncbi:MAG TPA: hypothetical protein ENN19_13590, partial [Chloroflexi bacterium]|nr:hypothetical protein [Chloroflexota bacterium]